MIRQFKLSRYYNKHILALSNNGVQAAVGLATSFVMFHYLLPAATGMYYFIQTFVGLVETCRNGFLATATVKFYAGTDEQRGKTVLGSVWVLAILLTIIILLLNAAGLLYLPYNNSQGVALCLKWVGVTYLSSLPADVIFWRLQAEEKYGKMFLYRMLNSLSTLIAFIVLIVVHRFTLENALLFNLVTNTFSSLVGILWNFSGFKNIWSASRTCILEIVHYGKYTLMTSSISQILGSADVWIIESVLGPTYVAVYSLATRFMQFIDLPLRTFVMTGMSEMAIQHNNKNMHQVKYIFQKYAGMLTLAFVPFTIIAFLGGLIFLKFIGGSQYSGAIGNTAITAYALLLIISIAYPIDRFNGLALDMIHQTRTNTYKVVVMLATKVVTGILLTVWLNNIYGVIYSTGLMTIAGIIYGYYRLSKHLDYTIPGTIALGFSEMKAFVTKEVKFFSKSKNNS